MSTDRADELRFTIDLWEEIKPNLSATSVAYHGLDALEEKFRRGESEHGRDWLLMSKADLLEEIRAELADIAIYDAMIQTRWPDTPSDEEVLGVPA